MYDYERPVSVQAYDPSLGTQQYSTVSVVVGFKCLRSGETYLLMIPQVIEITHLDHHLVCPIQCVIENRVLTKTFNFLCKNPDSTSHAVVARDPEELHQELVFCLTLQGMTYCLTVFKLTLQQYAKDDYI